MVRRKRETLVSDHILVKWSSTKAVLILVPLKKSSCLKCPEFLVTLTDLRCILHMHCSFTKMKSTFIKLQNEP